MVLRNDLSLKTTALLVQKCSDDYLPSFMRLETELAQLEAEEAARTRVQKLLEDGGSPWQGLKPGRSSKTPPLRLLRRGRAIARMGGKLTFAAARTNVCK